MKRKCLIEELVGNELDNTFHKKFRTILSCSPSGSDIKMHKNTDWFKSLVAAEKSCLKEDKIKKIHYKFQDGKEMVEEYNTDTQVMLRRAWKVKGALGGEGKWLVEVGDPIPDPTAVNVDSADIMETSDQPQLTTRNTKKNLEWRIRNLPYPIETYSVSANNDERCIIIRTTNKKYFKRLQVPELDRLKLKLEQANIISSHKFNTLIITYKKPQELLDMEQDWFQQLKNVKPITDIPKDLPKDMEKNCKTQ